MDASLAGKEKDNELVLVSEHNGSLLRRQPRATIAVHSSW
jgi:hypothetical protein